MLLAGQPHPRERSASLNGMEKGSFGGGGFGRDMAALLQAVDMELGGQEGGGAEQNGHGSRPQSPLQKPHTMELSQVCV